MKPMALTFYCDDTNPYDAPAEALRTFLDFAKSEGIRGEASFIPAYHWEAHGAMSRRASTEQSAFIEQAGRAFECGIDTHFELMTHGGVYDFAAGRAPEGAIHEGLWMYEPAGTVELFQAYFGQILAEGEWLGVRYSGMTQPGCGCDACQGRIGELRAMGLPDPNPAVWQALLNLAKEGKFRGQAVPCFFGGYEEEGKARLTASEGAYRVYDLQPNMHDRFGLWLNAPEHADADYYIRADGAGGRIVDLLRAGAPYALFYCHWQGVNPSNGVGWEPFKEVVKRVRRFLKDEVVWMRPSEYTDTL